MLVMGWWVSAALCVYCLWYGLYKVLAAKSFGRTVSASILTSKYCEQFEKVRFVQNKI
jgi:hypothetical protein